jgi:hypothetical protein
VVLQQSNSRFVEVAKIRLPSFASVFQGELLAISVALKHALDIELKNVSIYVHSDSRSSIELLRQYDPVLPTARLIHLQVRDLLKHNCKTKLLWVKGHSGVIGNETADLLAKRACTEGSPFDMPIYAMRSQYYKTKVRLKTDEAWQQEWNESQHGRLTHTIIGQVSSPSPFHELTKHLSNNSRSLIFQALTGHIPLKLFDSVLSQG